MSNKILNNLYLEIVGIVGIYPNVRVDCIYTKDKHRIFESIYYKLNNNTGDIDVTSNYLDITKNKDCMIAIEILNKIVKDKSCSRLKLEHDIQIGKEEGDN